MKYHDKLKKCPPLQFTLVSPHTSTRSLEIAPNYSVLTFRKIDARRIVRKLELTAHTLN